MTTFVGPLTLQQLATVLGRYRYLELALFEIVGQSVRDCLDPSLAVMLSETSHAHAYRAQQIEDLLLVSAGLPGAAELTVTPSVEHSAVLARLGKLGPAELADHLVGLWYPLMAETYQQHLEHCALASDGPVRRLLLRVIFDLSTIANELAHVLSDGSISEMHPTGQYDDEQRTLDTLNGPFGTHWA